MTSMDDIQPAPEKCEPPPMATEDKDNDAMTFDALEQPNQDRPATQTEDAPEISVPTAKIEVVIEKKAVLELEDPIFPDHYYDNGKIPVFKPTMDQFRNFEKFITRINDYGMQAGIVKVIPPPEWREALPPLDEQVKSIKLRNAIEQQFAGTAGVFRQMNIEKRRVYNLPQWRALCESTDHQPPAKRGEVRMAGHTVGKRKAQQQKQKARPSPKKPKLDTMASGNPSAPTEPWIPFTNSQPGEKDPALANNCINCSADVEEPTFISPMTDDTLCRTCEIPDNCVATIIPDGPNDNATPTTPQPQPPQFPSPEPSSTEEVHPQPPLDRSTSPEQIFEEELGPGLGRATTPLSSPVLKKRKRSGTSVDTADGDDVRDADDFRGFDYRIGNAEEYTVERCQELERIYWKALTFNNPLYGADMPGSLFDDRTEVWNVAKLDNLLCRIDKLIPGVNSAYLYLGMWKATFSWHVEDMDLYSINYIHFGAPKQWYSISQRDAEKFESFMRSHFPNDHKGCPQFMRHKTFLASPSALRAKGIKVNRLVHHEGEFVITFPFGYHSGYNLGYNCAESVNFATDEWLDIGRNARKCNCVGDSVNINVDDILDALRSPVQGEYEDVFSPPDCTDGMAEVKKPKRERKIKTEPKVIIKIKRFPCMLCPNSIVGEPLLPAGADKFAHRICAKYIPETYITTNEDGTELVSGIDNITPARWNLKCLYCSSTRGAKFQCSATSCCRAYHATCAAAAGVLVETAEDELGFVSSYQCRFHRPKRLAVMYLEQDQSIIEYASKLKLGDTIQARLASADNVPFVGTVTENCRSEETVSIELATGEIFEVSYKWILAPPKRDVRALCATQSVPGSTKKRQKKKPKVRDQSVPDTTSPSENTAPSGIAPTSINPPVISTPTTAPAPPPWPLKNPGLAQHHEFVWTTQTPGSSTGALTAEIFQRLPNPPPQSNIPVQPSHFPIIAPQRPEVRVPPFQRFNLPLPPPLLPYPPPRDVPIYPRPSMEDHQDVSAGILFVHSDLGQNQAWRDQYAAQFYRSPVAVTASQIRRPLPPLLPKPPIVSPIPQPIPQGAQPYVQHRNENMYPSQGQA